MSPTYKNNNHKTVEFLGHSLRPQEETVSFVFYEKLPMGIEKISDAPYYNNIVFSGCFMKGGVVEVSKELTRFNVHIYVEKGKTDIYLSSKENVPQLFLYEGAKWNMRYFERLINKIIIQPASDDIKVWVIIEKT